jgi:ATP-dependent Clp protease adaptor protein ClpS
MLPEITPDIEIERETAEEPPYRVIIHNDDVTPMEFVVHVLRSIFLLSLPRAVQVMYEAHYHGSATVQTCTKSEAVRRVSMASFAAGMEGYPLRFTIEPE